MAKVDFALASQVRRHERPCILNGVTVRSVEVGEDPSDGIHGLDVVVEVEPEKWHDLLLPSMAEANALAVAVMPFERGSDEWEAYRFAICSDFPERLAKLCQVQSFRGREIWESPLIARLEGLIALHGGLLTVLDVGKLERAAGFDPTYLHIKRRIAATA